jgi:hypothetical protein
MHWSWLLAQPPRNGCVRYEDWLVFHRYWGRAPHLS